MARIGRIWGGPRTRSGGSSPERFRSFVRRLENDGDGPARRGRRRDRGPPGERGGKDKRSLGGLPLRRRLLRSREQDHPRARVRNPHRSPRRGAGGVVDVAGEVMTTLWSPPATDEIRQVTAYF